MLLQTGLSAALGGFPSMGGSGGGAGVGYTGAAVNGMSNGYPIYGPFQSGS
jgi:hypothetical protein